MSITETLKNTITLSVKGQTTAEGKFDWCNALIDAGIITAVTVGTALGVAGSDGVFTTPEIVTLASTAVIEFFGWLAAKRKLKKE